jgi:hypothetical protein
MSFVAPPRLASKPRPMRHAMTMRSRRGRRVSVKTKVRGRKEKIRSGIKNIVEILIMPIRVCFTERHSLERSAVNFLKPLVFLLSLLEQRMGNLPECRDWLALRKYDSSGRDCCGEEKTYSDVKYDFPVLDFVQLKCDTEFDNSYVLQG